MTAISEEVRRAFEMPNGSSIQLRDWWIITRWWPAFKIFDQDGLEWLTVSSAIMREDGSAEFTFREGRPPSNGKFLINNWKLD